MNWNFLQLFSRNGRRTAFAVAVFSMAQSRQNAAANGNADDTNATASAGTEEKITGNTPTSTSPPAITNADLIGSIEHSSLPKAAKKRSFPRLEG